MLSADQENLASSTRAARVQFAAPGNPSTTAVDWPGFKLLNPRMLSFNTPTSQVERGFAADHKCAFWATAALIGKL